MKFETKTVTLLMCVALALLSSCNKKLPDTPVQEQQVPVGFRAMSQAVWVKSGETDPDKPKFSDIHDDFGVWGIARQEGIQSPYVLWSSNAITKVEELTTDPGVYAPVTAAYWIRDYKYNFLAVAPFEDTGLTLNGITTKETQASATPPVQNPVDFMTITYDMSSKYTAGLYTFDLLGAAAETPIISSGHKDSQQLMFWHLFSKLAIKVIFINESGEEITTGHTLTELTIDKVNTKGNFTIQFNATEGKTGNLAVAMNQINSDEVTLSFNSSSATDLEGRWIAHIVPQNISDLVINIKYKVTNDGKDTYYHDSISLANSSPAIYNSNDRYNWTLKINPKEPIGFHVQIADWSSEDLGNGGFDIL